MRLRRARLGVTLIFMSNGLVWANLAPRYPEIRTSIGLTYGEFGTAVMFGGLGALALGLTAAALIRRFTSARVGVTAMIAMAGAAALVPLAPNGIVFALLLFALGAIDSWVDVAQNSHGLRVQREYGRTIVNSFHAMWSVGAVLGGLMGGVAAGLKIPVAVHLAGVAVLLIAVNLYGYQLLLRGPEPESPVTPGETKQRAFPRVSRAVWVTLGMLSLVAIAGAWVEDSGISWSASYLFDELGAGATVASFGFVALMAMHFVGRMVGDRLTDLYGQRTVVRVGGLITAVGMGLALAFPSIPLTIIGFGLAGLGVATTIPAAMHAADELPGFRNGTGLTIVSWALRVGFILSPFVVGIIADATSLRTGLGLVVVAGVVLAILAQAMSNSRAHR
ncbi:MAG: MFS transporter [Actinobacteria bacterium HGW-Actinobacteria-4]|nr:MAG: MFS transporter [Actinobacteria bacterium HGW-Actinobacteria-4]